MFVLLDRLLNSMVRDGSLAITDARGESHLYGNGRGRTVAARIIGRLTEVQLAVDPDFHFGEAYMNRHLIMERGDISDLVALLWSNLAGRTPYSVAPRTRLSQLLRRFRQCNPIGAAKRNVAHHYDLSGQLYDLFLDRDRQYSCAYFENETQSLEEAQLAKKRHIAAKLLIKPGMRVLDIGSGWGGLGLYLAEVCGANVIGVTLSEEQHKLSNERAHQRGVADRAQFRLLDYRLIEDSFDRIVSVGMFEHVGVEHYTEFFGKVHSLLEPNGIALVHSINRPGGPAPTSRWIANHIFPGGHIPALSEVIPVVERSQLHVTDIEILRLHYAETLKEWRRRFLDRSEHAKAIYDERFCRMWEFYLASSEATFRYGGLNNFQIQCTRNQGALPLTRNYMQEEEERLREVDSRRPRFKTVPGE
ncbi:MAG: cyclopropane-fatty-acyl-phospholipid synthase family protein [Pseudomonadota bacterium]|nr:cyclopropane-fatty-acyl-phospholipid synthase family protein [Pseudomonadota bacterium]